MSVELWQAYHANGEPDTAEGLTIEAGRKGVLHGASHVWLYRRTEFGVEVLMQRRSNSVPTWPGYLDISAAGHIDYGETPLEAAIREAGEEINALARREDFRFAFVNRLDKLAFPEVGITENEIQWVYTVCEDDLQSEMRVDREEVDDIVWLPLAELRSLVSGSSQSDTLVVPHGQAYFEMLFASLETLG